MKQYANRHCKLRLLAQKLGIPQAMVVGLMENLWQWAADEVPDGGIGRYPDEIIAESMMWPWPEQVKVLIITLVDVGLLDKSSAYADKDPRRLYIHDWHEHCEDSVHKRLSRKRLLFARGQRPFLNARTRKALT